jgi:hypothetical protein
MAVELDSFRAYRVGVLVEQLGRLASEPMRACTALTVCGGLRLTTKERDLDQTLDTADVRIGSRATGQPQAVSRPSQGLDWRFEATGADAVRMRSIIPPSGVT